MASYDDLDFEWSLLCKENECAAWTENGKYLTRGETLSFAQFAYLSLFRSLIFFSPTAKDKQQQQKQPNQNDSKDHDAIM